MRSVTGTAHKHARGRRAASQRAVCEGVHKFSDPAPAAAASTHHSQRHGQHAVAFVVYVLPDKVDPACSHHSNGSWQTACAPKSPPPARRSLSR